MGKILSTKRDFNREIWVTIKDRRLESRDTEDTNDATGYIDKLSIFVYFTFTIARQEIYIFYPHSRSHGKSTPLREGQWTWLAKYETHEKQDSSWRGKNL